MKRKVGKENIFSKMLVRDNKGATVIFCQSAHRRDGGESKSATYSF